MLWDDEKIINTVRIAVKSELPFLRAKDAMIQMRDEYEARIAELEAQLKVRNATVAPAVVRPDFHIEEDYE